uniref:Uncharacterized protein n=1 Tax=Romanomermis culicivorax TaxID=13658 RepID=A0A915KNJ6_ROMCU
MKFAFFFFQKSKEFGIGILCRTLQGHGHWVNTMALNTDYAMRTGAFDPRYADLVYKDVQES